MAAEADPQSFMEPLLNALTFTLMWIGCGFVMRSGGWLTDAEVGGLSRFCGMLSLPCALFASIVDLDWSSVDWTLLLGIFVSKSIIFTLTMFASLLRSRSHEAIARAGLFAILCTASNDIAFSLTIISAIFPAQYTRAIYLFVPLQFALLNPVGLMMMEYGSSAMREQQLPQRATAGDCGFSLLRAGGTKLLLVFLSTLASPVMLATLLGLAANVCLHGRLPSAIRQFVQLGANAYTPTALLTVGTSLSAVGGSAAGAARLDGISALVGTTLIFVKVFVAALVMYHVCGVLTGYDAQIVSFAFVYGCMPPAPTVYVWARQYGVSAELTGRVLVVSLLVATPFIVVTGVVIDLGRTRGDLVSTRGLVHAATQAIDALALLAAAWLLLAFATSRRMCAGLRVEMVPLLLCHVLSSAAAMGACALADPLPLDLLRQLAQHMAVACAASLAVRLHRSLRTSPEQMHAERRRFHAACVAATVLVAAFQLLDRSGPTWPPGDPRETFACVFGRLNSRAPYARIAFLFACALSALLALLRFNARYLRTELRLAAEQSVRPDPFAGEASYEVTVVRLSRSAGRYEPPPLPPLPPPRLGGLARAELPQAAAASGSGLAIAPQPEPPSPRAQPKASIFLAPAQPPQAERQHAAGPLELCADTSLLDLLRAVRRSERQAQGDGHFFGGRPLGNSQPLEDWVAQPVAHFLSNTPPGAGSSESGISLLDGTPRLATWHEKRGAAAEGEEGEGREEGEWRDERVSESFGLASGLRDAAADAEWVEVRIQRRVPPPDGRSVSLSAGETIAGAAAARVELVSHPVQPPQMHTPARLPPHEWRRAGRQSNYIPLMGSLMDLSTDPHLDEQARESHAQGLNDTFNDSIRYLILLSFAIFSMLLGLSAALEDVAGSHLTTLQEELVVVTKLAFSGQVLVMLACFGFHPDYCTELRARSRLAGRRLQASAAWRAAARWGRALYSGSGGRRARFGPSARVLAGQDAL